MLSINDWAQQLQSLPVRSLMVAVVLLSFGIYGRLNARSSGGHVLMTRFDRRIPVGPNGKFEEFICKVGG